MDHPVVHFATVFMAFFAIMNPIANAPVFLGVTEGLDHRARRAVAVRSVLLAFVIVSVFAVGGREIFDLFGITLPAFRIAGGLIVALVGYRMLQGSSSEMHSESEGSKTRKEKAGGAGSEVWVSPLAIPILAGPGTIATAMSYAAQTSLDQVLRVIAAFAAMCALTVLTFLGAESLVRVVGHATIEVLTRLMGLILAVVGVQMVIAGVTGITLAAA